jgi:ADYC domain
VVREPTKQVLLAALVGLAAPALAGPPATVQSVTVIGTAFRVALSDGTVLPQENLQGTVLGFGDGSGQQRRLRIDTVERDARDPDGEVMLYALSEQGPKSGEWRSACEADPDGRRLGFPLAGFFTSNGDYVAAPGRLLITCTGGAEGKCVRFGYKPWRQTPDGNSLAPYYQTCVRMARADYCGDGVGHTRNGTPIDLFDHIGIRRDQPASGMSFEAAWGPKGAVCVSHTRLPDVLSTAALAELCPDRVTPNCNETTPALLFNRSFGR